MQATVQIDEHTTIEVSADEHGSREGSHMFSYVVYSDGRMVAGNIECEMDVRLNHYRNPEIHDVTLSGMKSGKYLPCRVPQHMQTITNQAAQAALDLIWYGRTAEQAA